MYLDPVIVVIQQQDAAASHLLGLHHGLEVCQETHVLGHVSSEHLQQKFINKVQYTAVVSDCDIQYFTRKLNQAMILLLLETF